MTEKTNLKKFLTEKVLGECWDADKRPGGDLPNRTFDNESDMMELYRAIYMDGKWNKFFDWAYWVYRKTESGTHKKFVAWLFCLGDKNYESKCKMVAKFYGWEENK